MDWIAVPQVRCSFESFEHIPVACSVWLIHILWAFCAHAQV